MKKTLINENESYGKKDKIIIKLVFFSFIRLNY